MDLKTRLAQAVDAVRSYPDSHERRLALIQYLCMSAKWEQALKQIGQYRKLFPDMQKPLMLYLIENIEAEMRRESVLTAKQKPQTLEQHSSKLAVLQRQLSLAAHVFERETDVLAADYAALSESVDGVPVKIAYFGADKEVSEVSGGWIIDGDARTSFVYEFFYRGQYYWQTWDAIESISFKAPDSLLDVIWRPCEITLVGGETMQCVSPARYAVLPAEAETEWSDSLLACSQTRWQAVADDLYVGFGQKMLYTDQADLGLLDIRSIHFEHNH
ncbi:MAG: type VI secretion system accessory protein TagJ [Neisseria sp.]|uniref:type VI secretion system accessory protein TagJ n=1 Tax=Neisseria sp. TaxID=192066 RepID=UPI0026DB7A56|nr:type VI secretion system accessory protein TagJ [Neisseria sp.]MDO4640974.1 type VI secretion system accessory protein TagJ [Neisseria sp.]